MRLSCWKKTGCLITDDSSKDNNIKLEGLPNCLVPPTTFLDPLEQNVAESTIPEEKHIDNVEEPIQLRNDTHLLENEEERNIFSSIDKVERKERNVLFDFIDELVLEPQSL